MKRLFVSILLCLSLLGTLCFGAENAEELLARLNKLPPAQRQQQLLEKARQERDVSVYASFTEAKSLSDAFRKRYPSPSVTIRRLGGGRMLDIAVTEFRAGRHLVDVFIGGSTSGRPLIDAGVIARYASPERAQYGPHFKDEKGYWTAFFSRHLVFAFNTTLVPQERLPKSYFDLLNPYWKGRLAIDDHPGNWLAGMIKAYGKEKAAELLRALARQNPKIIRGRTLKIQLMAAGEVYAAVDQTEEGVIEMKKKGAPVDYRFLENTPVLTNPVLLVKNAPHPHAGALFLDYLLSKEGQQAVVDIDYVPTRMGFKPKDRELTERAAKAKLVFFDLDWFGERQKEINDLINEHLRPNR
ncbi:MAG: extracellular solute-binding protein [Deltaproteobacteria bacterium]|nr:extracellular solute-binding protein [Deltaproteobacteria bacterium]